MANKLESTLQFIVSFCLSFEGLSTSIVTGDTKQGICIVGAFHLSRPPGALKKKVILNVHMLPLLCIVKHHASSSQQNVKILMITYYSW